jgi:ankyrin repeat protein
MRIVKILIEHGANLHGSSKVSALLETCRHNNSIIVSIPLNNGADPTPIVRHMAYTPVSHATLRGKRDLIRLLLERVANINARDLKSGYTLMHQAAVWGIRDLVMPLLELQGRTDILDNNGKTPLELAKSLGNRQVAELLEKEVTFRESHTLNFK